MLKKIAAAASLVLALLGVSWAQERGSENEAKAMVEQAMLAVKTLGVERAFTEFSTPGGKWHAKDLYLFCYKLDGTNTCHGANKALIGKNLIDLQTADGQLLIKNMVGIANGKGSGWIEYRWPHPQTKMLEDKKAWVVRIPGQDYFIGVGVYR